MKILLDILLWTNKYPFWLGHIYRKWVNRYKKYGIYICQNKQIEVFIINKYRCMCSFKCIILSIIVLRYLWLFASKVLKISEMKKELAQLRSVYYKQIRLILRDYIFNHRRKDLSVKLGVQSFDRILFS